MGIGGDFGDGVIDGIEVELGTDPNNAGDTPVVSLNTLAILGGVLALLRVMGGITYSRRKRTA